MISKELLEAISNTNSPTERLRLIIFDLSLSSEERSYFSILYQKQVDKKREQGLEAIHKRVFQKKKKSTKRSYDHPFFAYPYTAKQECRTCHEKINSDCAFRQKIENIYYDNHALPECFPSEHQSLMLIDRNYIKYMEPKNEKEKD